MDGLSGGRMIVRFQKENLLLEAEDTLISVGGSVFHHVRH